MSNIWCTFVAKFIARKFQKSPYLVTLLPSSDGGGADGALYLIRLMMIGKTTCLIQSAYLAFFTSIKPKVR